MWLERRLFVTLWSVAALLELQPASAGLGLLNRTAHLQPAAAADAGGGNGDPAPEETSAAVADATQVVFTGEMPPSCSCDCCEAAERLPSEAVAGKTLGFKCIPGSQQTDSCPAQCHDMSPAGQTDPASDRGASPVDYRRYCMARCQASLPTAGTICMEMPPPPEGEGPGAEAAAVAAAVAAAGGDQDVPEWKKEIEAKQKEAAQAEEDEQKAIAVKRYVTWDMRKLVAERLRAEAGASMSHGAAAGERVRLNTHLAERNHELLKKVNEALAPQETKIDESKTNTKQEADKAIADAKRAKKLLKGAKVALAPTLKSVKQLTIDAIQKETVVAAQEEASAFAARLGWDEPDNERKIVANKASEPYLKAMVTSLQRVSEYKAAAQGLAGQARATQAKAQGLSAHATAMEAQGDMLGAVAARHEIKQLLEQAKGLQGQAQAYWKTAQDADASVKKWQEAGYAASVYAVQEYDIGREPPKGV